MKAEAVQSAADVPDLTTFKMLGTKSHIAHRTASLTLYNLQALSLYAIMCLAVDERYGTTNAANAVVFTTRLEASTTCCHLASIQMVIPTVAYGVYDVNVVEIALAVAPTDFLTVEPIVRYSPTSLAHASILAPIDTESTLYPNAMNITKYDSTYVAPFMLMETAVPGFYHITVALRGPSASSYSAKHTRSEGFAIVDDVNMPPPPVLLSARFSNDGTAVLIEFDRYTNRALLLGIFSCDKLFQFVGSDSAKCVWTDNRRVTMQLGPEAMALVGHIVTLVPHVLKARCPIKDCSDWTFSDSSSVPIHHPKIPLIPKVSASGPKTLGSCDVLVLDLTGSSGSGGREWSSVVFDVVSDAPNVNDLNAYLNSEQYKLVPPSTIARTFFSAPYDYVIHIRVCNFLSQCGYGIYTFATLVSIMPTLRIQGPPVRQMKTMQELKLFSTGVVLNCDKSETYTNLLYSWSVFELIDQVIVPANIKSISGEIKTFRLPGNTLKVGSTYLFKSQLNYTVFQTYTKASAVVEVIMGNVIAKITGGAARSVTVNDTTSLDAFGSFDEDDANTVLQYQWICITIRPSYDRKCGVSFDPTFGTSKVQATIMGLTPDTTSRITVLVRDPLTGRSSQAYVDITVVKDAASDVDVDQSYVNVDRKVQFTGRIKSEFGGDAAWLIDDPSISLTTRALTPTTLSVSDEEAIARGRRINFGFALSGFSLMENMKYTFSMLFVPTKGSSVKSSVSVATNGGLRPGTFDTKPHEGYMLETSFAYFASRWSDLDLPLTYAFSYSTDGESYFTMQSRS